MKIRAENHGDLTTKKLFKIFEIYNFVIYNNKKAVFCVCERQPPQGKECTGWNSPGPKREQQKDTRERQWQQWRGRSGGMSDCSVVIVCCDSLFCMAV